MDVINKTTAQTIRTLTEVERNAITQYVLGETLSTTGIKIQELLTRWHENKRWIKCDCHPRTGAGSLQSIEHLKKNDAGTLYFVRNSSSAMHSELCAFHSESRSAPRVTAARKTLKSCVLNFHGEISSKGAAASSPNPTRSNNSADGTSQRRSSLGSLMLNLMNEAALNRLSNHNDKVYVASLNEPAKRFEVAKGISLESVFVPSLTTSGWLDQRLSELAGGWPKKSRPYGMMAGVVNTVERQSYLGSRTHLGHPLTTGPYLVLGTYTNKTSEPGSRNFYLMRIVTIPVVDVSWPMPVESNLEREVAKKLKQLMYSMQQDYNIELSLEKPLIDTAVGKDLVRCDFVLKDSTSKKTLAIEVMGYKDDEYLDRKDRQIPIMRTLYTSLIEVEMSGTEEQKKKSLKTMSIEVRKFFS
ncbi:MAG: hypothetical protein Q7T27_12310 [Pseudomonas sp.]|uniref:hypothetical protein n=1 Tax=Pseudomonas sp. TaxID=306 RepID=UPI0027245505|nr:hypothetical protein [Pseudomonas sp.]MDO8404264.1 hypothetical protein [Pseudomonas sp.]